MRKCSFLPLEAGRGYQIAGAVFRGAYELSDLDNGKQAPGPLHDQYSLLIKKPFLQHYCSQIFIFDFYVYNVV